MIKIEFKRSARPGSAFIPDGDHDGDDHYKGDHDGCKLGDVGISETLNH